MIPKSLNYLSSLLHLSDPTLPIGGFSHSNGLETFVQKNIVIDADTAKEFISNMLQFNLKYNDAAFVKLSYEATADNNIEELLQLNTECNALKTARETREASQKLGVRLLKIFNRQLASDFIVTFQKSANTEKLGMHYSIVFGMIAYLSNIPLMECLYGFYHSSVSGMITNAVKLVPLGQLEGQDILFSLYPIMEQTTLESLYLDRESVGLCNPSFDIRCMQHERLYSRLYMS